MFKYIISFVFLVITIVFIYFGYYQDYKRNPKEFKRTLIVLPFGVLAKLFRMESLNKKIKDWANLEDEKEN